jgi:hypothetical protein
MTKAQTLIKNLYSEHFRRLREIAEHIDSLKAIAETVSDPTSKARIDEHIKMLNSELRSYAENLEESGKELFRNAA